tara:strand:+ start:2356 stop:3546 length:1191 start_codon:yes stop_codon:yes gene_type:complete
MKKSNKKGQNNGIINELTTFNVPLTIKEINPKINLNTKSEHSKREIINQAIKFHSEGNISKATKYYKYCLDNNFDDPIVFSNYGVILKDLGKLKQAEILTRKAIRIKPDYADAYNNLGNILKKLGHLNQAEVNVRKAIEIKPDFANAHLNLGSILKELGKLKESKYEEKKGIDINFIQNIDSRYKDNCIQNLKLSKSQFRQDLFALSEVNFKKRGFFVEFGSCDGLVGSNSYLLEKVFNWSGILAEPVFYWHSQLKKNRSASIETKCVWNSSGEEILFNEMDKYKQLSTIDCFSKTYDSNEALSIGKKYRVRTISLVDLLNKYRAPKYIDYLSIDTEGSEYEILKAFDFNQYKFRVITCEHNFTPIRDKIYDLLINKGYKRKHTTLSRVDDWYILA